MGHRLRGQGLPLGAADPGRGRGDVALGVEVPCRGRADAVRRTGAAGDPRRRHALNVRREAPRVRHRSCALEFDPVRAELTVHRVDGLRCRVHEFVVLERKQPCLRRACPQLVPRALDRVDDAIRLDLVAADLREQAVEQRDLLLVGWRGSLRTRAVGLENEDHQATVRRVIDVSERGMRQIESDPRTAQARATSGMEPSG